MYVHQESVPDMVKRKQDLKVGMEKYREDNYEDFHRNAKWFGKAWDEDQDWWSNYLK